MGITSSSAEFETLSAAAKEMGESTKFSASQAGEALNYLALAGYDANKAVAALPTVLNVAAAGGMELASASDMITDAMSALGLETSQMSDFSVPKFYRSILFLPKNRPFRRRETFLTTLQKQGLRIFPKQRKLRR